MNLIDALPRSIAVNPLSVIDRVIAELELTPSLYDNATASYEAVAAVLAKFIPGVKIVIFPQGSMRKGTTILPITGEVFDLDMVCWIEVSGQSFTPEQIFNVVWEALGKDDTYRRMRRKKNRCITLEYHPSCKYKLDVVPAVSDWTLAGALRVPDRERKIWCSSHPVAYCDDWFKKACAVLPTIRPLILNRSQMASVVMANAASAKIEPMPKFGQFEKKPLQRIVQVLKRSRDEFFQNAPEHRPSSILLTTITAHAYSECVSQPAVDMLEFVINVVNRIPKHILVTGNPPHKRFSILNPVNEKENFAENWSEEHYNQFIIWHRLAAAALEKLQSSKGLGNDVMLLRLSETFGRDRIIKAAQSLGAHTNKLHDAGKLRIASGTVGTVGSVIPATINFGSK